MSLTSGERSVLFGVVNRQINEARINDQVYWDPQYNLGILMSHLVLQAPNRVYFSPHGVMGKVLFFNGEEYPYGAYLQISEETQDEMRELEARYFEFPEQSALEKEIVKLRKQFHLEGDLIEGSSALWEVLYKDGKPPHTPEFLHISNKFGNDSLGFGYHYTLTKLGVRAYDMGRLTKLSVLGAGPSINLIYSVPQVVLDYAHPFTTK